MATFPSSIPPQDVAALVPHARDEGSPSRSKCGTPLLVCADATALRSGRSALESAGFAVSRAAGWTEALALSQELQPGVVLVDDAFPTGDGGRLCEALRRLPGGSELPVLMICRNRASIDRALEAGATDVVGKPLDWQVVSRRLARLEKAFRTTQELEHSQAMLAEARRVAADASVRLEGQGAFDSLTGLPSRAHLDRLVERALASSRHAGAGVAVLFLDLDRFTEINDSLGRQGGDEALKQVAHRLAECLRKTDLLGRHAPGYLQAAARLSGDEFALMLTGVLDEEALSRFARVVLDMLSRPIPVGGTEVFLSASIGISFSSGPGSPSKLVQEAETALYEAKKRGGATFWLYRASLSGAAESKLGLDRRLRAAFDRGELCLYYQPVVESSSGRVVAAEALLRWADPSRGLVSPLEFIPVAEDTGLMTTIGAWVLRQASRQLRAWMDGGLPAIRMAVNVSRCQLRRGDFPATVQRVLEEVGLDPWLLELEISERGALRDEPAILAQFRELKTMGVRIIVDDFGTGQSGIAFLRQFPLDGLKIDRSFVRHLTEDLDDAAIISAIIAMAHRLRLDVVAEGVEQQAQADILREYGCADVQGYLFSRPLPSQEFCRTVQARDGMAHLSPSSGLLPA